jgi:hypothetical protein
MYMYVGHQHVLKMAAPLYKLSTICGFAKIRDDMHAQLMQQVMYIMYSTRPICKRPG